MKREHPALQAARERRNQGRYDGITLRLFHRAWYQRRDPVSLIAWLRFRRDLGYPLSARHYSRLKGILGRGWWRMLFDGVSPSEAERGRMLCREYEFQEADSGSRLPHSRPRRWDLWEREVQSRKEFLEWLSERRAKGIALVGNGAQRPGVDPSGKVDDLGTVIRFNRFSASAGTEPAIGTRLDVWVRAPDFRGPAPVAEWTILTGPASQFTLWALAPIERQVARGTKLVCVPLDPWRNLVRRLEAPPSSGVQLAFWFSQFPDLAAHLRLFGFGYHPDQDEGYHQALPRHQPSPRHNWARERAILEELVATGSEG